MTEAAMCDITTSLAIRRSPKNPLLSAEDIPYPSTLVCNAGVVKYQGRYVMVFRNEYFPDGLRLPRVSSMGLAFSDNGIDWNVEPQPCFSMKTDEIKSAYDPRLSVIDGRVHMCFAVDTHHGVRGGVAVTDDFYSWEILGLSAPDNRNMVLFPEKIGGNYIRLERPFPIYSRYGYDERFDIWISDSPDLVYWGNSNLLMGVEDVPFANLKIGPGAPPVKTDKGWLTTFHAVDFDASRGKNGWEELWQKRYTGGILLFDLEDPRKIVGMSRDPLIVPEARYETEGGARNNVVFPGGMILEDDGEVKIYYGAADTWECLATADVGDLINLCLA